MSKTITRTPQRYKKVGSKVRRHVWAFRVSDAELKLVKTLCDKLEITRAELFELTLQAYREKLENERVANQK